MQVTGPGGPGGFSEPAAAAGQQDAPDLSVSVSGDAGSVGPAACGEPAGVCAGVLAAPEGDRGHPEGFLEHCAYHAERQGQQRAAGPPSPPPTSSRLALLKT